MRMWIKVLLSAGFIQEELNVLPLKYAALPIQHQAEAFLGVLA